MFWQSTWNYDIVTYHENVITVCKLPFFWPDKSMGKPAADCKLWSHDANCDHDCKLWSHDVNCDHMITCMMMHGICLKWQLELLALPSKVGVVIWHYAFWLYCLVMEFLIPIINVNQGLPVSYFSIYFTIA